MAANCLPYDPQQSMLLPEALQEWLPEGHLAHFINDTVDGLDLSVQVVRLAREMGLVKLGTIAVDGTKVKANASRHKAMSYGHMLKAEAELKAQDNFTDPDSRIMRRAGGGFDPAHNGQTAVDDKAHIIVAAELGNCAADVGELPRMLNAVKANVGVYRADAGRCGLSQRGRLRATGRPHRVDRGARTRRQAARRYRPGRLAAYGGNGGQDADG